MSGSAEEVRKHIATYKKIAAALAVGTIVTVLASYLDVSVAIGITIALIIATTKASLVVNYFMHLGEERSQWLMVSLGLTVVFWFVLMLVPLFTMSDNIGAGVGLDRQKLSEQAREAIRERIVGGEFPLGRKLPEAELVGLLKMSKSPIREATVHHSFSGMFALRQGSWKLIVGRGSGGFTNPRKIKPKPGEAAGQLYNLAADPREEKNLYLDKPEVVTRLKKLLNKYREDGRSAP